MCFVILVVALSDFWKNPMGIKAGCRHSVCVHKCGFGSDCKSINRRQRPAVRCCDETFMQRCPWPVGALRQMNSIKIFKWFFRVRSEACSQVLHKTGSYERVMKTKEVNNELLHPMSTLTDASREYRETQAPCRTRFLSRALPRSLSLTHSRTQTQWFRQTPAASFLADCAQSLSRHTSGGEVGRCALRSSAM